MVRRSRRRRYMLMRPGLQFFQGHKLRIIVDHLQKSRIGRHLLEGEVASYHPRLTHVDSGHPSTQTRAYSCNTQTHNTTFRIRVIDA